MPHADLLKYETTHRRALTSAHNQYIKIADRLNDVIADIRRRSDLDPSSVKRLEAAARQAARDQLAAAVREHEQLTKEAKGLLRRARRDDSWIPARETAIASHGSTLEPLLRSMTTGPTRKPLEFAVRDLLDELVADGNPDALLWLRRSAPRMAAAAGTPLTAKTLRDLDILAGIHAGAEHVTRATVLEEELEDMSKLRIAAGHLDGELETGKPVHVVPAFGTKELTLRHGATRDSNGQLIIPPPDHRAADNQADAAEREQIAKYRETVFALPQGTGGDYS